MGIASGSPPSLAVTERVPKPLVLLRHRQRMASIVRCAQSRRRLPARKPSTTVRSSPAPSRAPPHIETD